MTVSEENLSESEEILQLDVTRLLVRAWKQFKKTWWLLFVLLALGAAASLGYHHFFHRDRYEAYASFSVSAGSQSSGLSDYNTRVSLKKLGETFPYILESGALKNVVREELGLSSLPVTISAKVVSDTSLFRMSVIGSDPELCCRALDAVIENYPLVAKYVIGNTTLTMLDYSGIPSRPTNALDRREILIRGAQIGLVVYLGVLSLLILTRRTVESENDLKRYTSIRCLGSIPYTFLKKRSGKKKQLLLIGRKYVPSSFDEAISLLRVRTLREMDRKQQQVLLITSAGELEGKSTVASNLALSCAQKGFRVLLIDGDLRHPSVADRFGAEVKRGTADVLSGKAELSQAIQPWANTSLDLLPGGRAISAADIPKVLVPERIEALIAYARERYDYVFVDTPPCGIMQDALLIADSCDATMAVIRQDYLARTRILEVLDLLADTNAGILGCVINGESGGVGSYGYGRYGYGSGYGQYGRYGKYGKYGKSKYTKKKS